MIKLLTISGSPVSGSSTDLLLHRTAGAIIGSLGPPLQIEHQFVKLNELKYIPCQACGKAPTPQFCFFEDDLTAIYPQLAECDCLLFGSPVYFDSVSGQAKLFIDRCNCFRPYDFEGKQTDHRFVKILTRKRPGAIILVGGDDAGIESARRTIAGFFKWVEVINEGVVKYSSRDDRAIGTAAADSVVLQQADVLGHKLGQILRETHER